MARGRKIYFQVASYSKEALDALRDILLDELDYVEFEGVGRTAQGIGYDTYVVEDAPETNVGFE